MLFIERFLHNCTSCRYRSSKTTAPRGKWSLISYLTFYHPSFLHDTQSSAGTSLSRNLCNRRISPLKACGDDVVFLSYFLLKDFWSTTYSIWKSGKFARVSGPHEVIFITPITNPPIPISTPKLQRICAFISWCMSMMA